MRLSTGKYWNREGGADFKNTVRISNVYAGSAVISRKIQAWKVFSGRSTAKLFCTAHLKDRRLIIRARGIGTTQSFFHAHWGQRFIGSSFGQIELLPRRNSNGT